MGFILGLDVAHERKRGVMDDSKVFGLSNWVKCSLLTEKNRRWAGGEPIFTFGHAKFEMHIILPNG